MHLLYICITFCLLCHLVHATTEDGEDEVDKYTDSRREVVNNGPPCTQWEEKCDVECYDPALFECLLQPVIGIPYFDERTMEVACPIGTKPCGGWGPRSTTKPLKIAYGPKEPFYAVYCYEPNKDRCDVRVQNKYTRVFNYTSNIYDWINGEPEYAVWWICPLDPAAGSCWPLSKHLYKYKFNI